MKKALLLILLYLVFTDNTNAQTIAASMTGYPIVTTGWTIANNASAADSEIVLTTSAGSEFGEVYYNTSLNVTACGQFAVDFDWKITASTFTCLGDGIAFWFINPMTSFAGGGSLGLPNPLTGFIFTLDSYDNDGDGLNPECELFGYPTSSGYSESDGAHRLAPILPHVSYMADGSWHHCKITYNGGTIKVYLNGSSAASMTGTFPITTSGYFGFSAGTGACIAKQSIKQVFITSATISPIFGTTTICQGSTSPLVDSTTGGTWSSSNPGVATVVPTTGVVTAVTPGTSVITYSYNFGACTATTTVNVVPPPSAITGPVNVCVGSTTTLSDGTAGGTWSSSSSSVATIGSVSGSVSAVGIGATTITYATGPSCYVTTTLNVISVPVSITGIMSVCTGGGTTLSDATTGGTWSSGSPGVATIDPATGASVGIIPGTSTMTYSIGGTCTTTTVVTVNPTPGPITGPSGVCVGSTITLVDTTAGGTWSSSSSIATVSSTGVVGGVTSGLVAITYKTPAGCAATKTITVNPLPAGIFSPSGGICVGACAPLFDGSAGGTWTSSSPAIATIGLTTGVACGVSDGTATIVYTLPTGCFITGSLVVNPLPAIVSGTTSVCIGGSATLSDATGGGTWISTSPGIATVDELLGTYTGVSGGTTTISYILLSTSCISTAVVTVNFTPPAIIGATSVCSGTSTTLTDLPGGTWSSSDLTLASVGLTTGVVTASTVTTTRFVTITYTSLSGCTTTHPLTIYALPPVITGAPHVCVGQTTTLFDGISLGTWVSSNSAIATIGAATGVVYGNSPGTDTITYTIGTGCSIQAVVTVNSAPGAISGIPTVCTGATTTLSDAGGGTWISSSPSIGSVVSTTGVVTGGVVTIPTPINITYSLGGACVATLVVTVYPIPGVITGTARVCVGATTTLSDPAGAGTWSSLSTAIATTVSPSGVITGVGPGTTTIIYTSSTTGCSRTTTVTVNVLPAVITGDSSICSGQTVTLSDSVTGGTWSASGTATISSVTGVLTGGVAGTATITYKITATGCLTTTIVTVNPLPAQFTVTGGGGYCAAGGTGVHIGLSGSATGFSYQVFSGTTSYGFAVPGTGSPLDFGIFTAAGVYTVLATNSITGCTRTMTGGVTVTINPTPVISGATAVCVGSNITLTATPACGTWSSSNPANATVSSTGVVTGLITGTLTVITYTSCAGCPSGTYTVNVSPSPSGISGPASVCVGASATETDVVTGGLWTSSNISVATIGSTSGIVNGVTPGTTLITYSLGTGCTVTRTMTVTPAPGVIGGPRVVCSSATITLTDPTGGGTWSSSPTTIGTINLTSGVLLGETAGVDTVTYTVGGCTATAIVTVNFAPTGLSGPGSVCTGSFITLTDGITGGTWTSSNTATASVSGTGEVTGGAVSASTTVTITYSLGGTCVATKTITVNPIYAIAGATGICVGATTDLTDPATGGTWSSSTTATATVVSASGIVSGVSPGTTLITYITSAGCTATTTVSVSTAPVAITGVFTVCAGGDTTQLRDPVGGGLWSSSSPGIATIGTLTGIVTGVSPGTTIITYSLGTGCTKTATVTVNPLPAVTVTTTRTCPGSTITIGTATPTGGTWGDRTGIATVNPTSGTVLGGSPGVDTITYTISTGCTRNIPITINPLPSPISGATTVCERATTALSDGVAGGTWSSSAPSIASVGSLSGIVTAGASTGSATIVYTLTTGCSVSVTINVIAPPPTISGPPSVCVGQTATLIDATTGGTWSSVNPAVATIAPGTGVVSGVSSGTVVIFYTVGTGCAVPTTIIVNPLSPIIGDNVVCMGQTITLTDTTDDGVWSSSAPSIASVVTTSATTGLVYGVSAGTTAVITYLLPTGCVTTHTVTVNAAPPAIAGTPKVCVGFTTLLSDPGGGTGSWSSSDAGIASVDASGVVWGISDGIATITFTNGTTVCPATINVTVNPLPAPIAAPANVCIGSIVDLASSPGGGTWLSSNATIATAGLTSGHVGGVLFGSVTIAYTLPTGCFVTVPLNVDTLPSPITGNLSVCVGSATALSDASPAGIWISSNPTAAPVSPGGVVSGLVPGAIVPEHYLLSATGCVATALVTVDALPSAIAPTAPTLCQGATLALTDFSAGGTWMSSDNTIATIDSSTGHTIGTGPGSATITYTIGTGCIATTTIFVNAAPDPIAGSAAICNGSVVSMTDATTGGTWISSNMTVATVDGSGNVSGIALGTSAISYTVAGCPAILNVTVNPHPDSITGAAQVCQGSAIILGDDISGGTWVSSDFTIATINTTTGILTGLAPGSITATYSLGAGCTTFTTVVINEVPATPVSPATGITEVCKYASILLYDGTSGGTWSSSNISVATIGSTTGVASGLDAGTTTIVYTLSTGCSASAILTVNAAPSPISGSANICFGTPNSYTDLVTGGVWSSSASAIATIDPISGVATGVTLGSATISYVFGACTVTKLVNVYPLPSSFNVSGGGSYCAGGTGVHIRLDSSITGVNYVLFRGVTATGTFAGSGDSLDFGLQTVAGTYTVEAISTATTCSSAMTGSALVTIMPSVLPSVSINATPGDTVCAGTSTTFTPTPGYGGTPTYQWHVNGTSVSSGPSYTFIPANGDVVSVMMTSTGACAVPAVVSHSVTMTVNPFKHPSVVVVATPGGAICQGTAVSFTANPLFGGTAPVYTWMKNGTALGTGSTYTYVPGNGDSVRCIMISNYPCSTGGDTVSSAAVVVTVDSPMLPVVTIKSSPGTNIGRNQFDTLTAVVANGGVFPVFQWYMNGYPIAGATSATYISDSFEITREDSVSCQVTSDAQCPATSYMWVYINASNVGVAQVGSAGSEINVIPNPNKGEFTIKGTLATANDQDVSLALTDMLGQVVYRSKVIAHGGRINERITVGSSSGGQGMTIPNGMYILSLHADSENKVFHIVIEQ